MTNVEREHHQEKKQQNMLEKSFNNVEKTGIEASVGTHALNAVKVVERGNSASAERIRVYNRVSTFERRYGFKIVFEKRDVVSTIGNVNKKVKLPSYEKVLFFLSRLESEMNKYPANFIKKSGLKNIVLTDGGQQNLDSRFSSGGFYLPGDHTIVVGIFSSFDSVVKVLHHEFFHFFEDKFNKSMNADNQHRNNINKRHGASYAWDYGKTNTNEDQATVVDSLFQRGVGFTKRAYNDLTIRTKIQIMTGCKLNNAGTGFVGTVGPEHYRQYGFSGYEYYPKWTGKHMGIEHWNSIIGAKNVQPEENKENKQNKKNERKGQNEKKENSERNLNFDQAVVREIDHLDTLIKSISYPAISVFDIKRNRTAQEVNTILNGFQKKVVKNGSNRFKLRDIFMGVYDRKLSRESARKIKSIKTGIPSFLERKKILKHVYEESSMNSIKLWLGEYVDDGGTIDKNTQNNLVFSPSIPPSLIKGNISKLLQYQYSSVADIMNDPSIKTRIKQALQSCRGKRVATLKSLHGRAYDFMVQAALHIDGHARTVGTIDAVLGNNTRTGIRAYQRKHGLGIDGVFGNECITNYLQHYA